MAAAPVGIGDVVAGKYVVERVIGEGGMGVVLAARHRELDTKVAIKCLLPEIAEQGLAAERFRREARAAARMRGEHICRVLDVGTLDSGIPYMVMEYLDGCDLASEVERRGRLPVEEAVGYLLEACEALAEAHSAGVIHRDLKPANLFLAQRSDGTRTLKVLDFGVSKSLLDAAPGLGALTKTSSLVGSPLYMSPEQLDSARDVDVRTDVWGLGVVLFELLTGHTPFSGESIPQLVAAVLHDPPRRLSEFRGDLPDGLEVVAMRAIDKQREQRFASVAELALALEPFARSSVQGAAARVKRIEGGVEPSVRTAVPHTPADKARGTPLSWDRARTKTHNRTLWGAAGFALLVALGALGYFAYRRAAPQGALAPVRETKVTAASSMSAATTADGVAPQPAEPVRLAVPNGAPLAADRAQDATRASAAVSGSAPEASQTNPRAAAPDAREKPAGVPSVEKREPASLQPSAASARRVNTVEREPPPPSAAIPRARPRVGEPAPSAPKPSVPAISDFGGRR